MAFRAGCPEDRSADVQGAGSTWNYLASTSESIKLQSVFHSIAVQISAELKKVYKLKKKNSFSI